MKKIIVKHLIIFLKKHNAYEKFRANNACDAYCGLINKKSDFSWFYPKNSIHISMLIDQAFMWSLTQEGMDYWVHIHDEWKKYCNIVGLYEKAISN